MYLHAQESNINMQTRSFGWTNITEIEFSLTVCFLRASGRGSVLKRALDCSCSSLPLIDPAPVFTVVDTQFIQYNVLNEWQTFGFVNITGYCKTYENGPLTHTYRVVGAAPVLSYL
ncbi:uncharacterized protein BJ212DRAFT_54893 [Suillus subaureus]|uniref:Uncharacterized protein n=1 Tax=Suillus subaureus TaxID=48587 RepID=A0A9P7EQ31_9AGAM|nr:uncharacterized protein BJ212DRAFT_54893 [Suillus subaureus]KAG1827464.1 hypothetical protein BJ212DRAFT_54893 [Suillus subaureus]